MEGWKKEHRGAGRTLQGPSRCPWDPWLRGPGRERRARAGPRSLPILDARRPFHKPRSRSTELSRFGVQQEHLGRIKTEVPEDLHCGPPRVDGAPMEF